MRTILALITCVLITLLTSNCAQIPGPSPNDPYEKYNRLAFAFNQDIDHMFYRPAAKIYTTLTPPQLRAGVTNFFNNVDEITTFANDILQAKFKYAAVDFWRFVINSTIGIGGLFDIASRMHLPRHYEDFGLTLAYWSGGTPSPYFVIPFLGSSTFRAGFGKLADIATKPWTYITPRSIPYSLLAVYIVNTRSLLLPADKLVDTSFDPYVFIRNAYLQRRTQAIRANEKPYQTLAEREKNNGYNASLEQSSVIPITQEALRPVSAKNKHGNKIIHPKINNHNPVYYSKKTINIPKLIAKSNANS